MGKSLKLSLLVMGASGIVGQVALLREMLVSFFGNELTLGIILANWLLLEAAGALLGGRIAERTPRKLEIYVLLQLVFSLAFPLSVFLSRIFKNVFFETPGEALGLAAIFSVSFLLLLPVALAHGALFPFGCKLYAGHDRDKASSIGKVYILETLGSILGGVLITFFLVRHLSSPAAALVIALANALVSIALLRSPAPADRTRFGKVLLGFSVSAAVLFLAVLSPPVLKRIHSYTLSLQWKGLDVLHSENSPYGNITVTRQDEQFTFFVDGLPSITVPDPDAEAVEDFVHFPLLHHRNPESVLVLSGGAGGVLREILKHPVRRVDYVELDPLVLKLVRRFSTPLTRSELADPRVHVHYADGRFFVNRTEDRYDVILVGLSAPQELQTNRLFTQEFFSIAREKLNEEGLLVISLPGSLTYLSPQMRDLNRCIADTLESVFARVKTVPGDSNLYLASDSPGIEEAGADELSARLEERDIASGIFTEHHISYRLHESRLLWFRESLEGAISRLNSDFRPAGVFYSLALWNARFAPGFSDIFTSLGSLKPASFLGLGILIPVLLLLVFLAKPRLSAGAVPYAVFTSGLCGMIFQLSVILTFQSLFGYLYHLIGLLLTVFMAGTAYGSLHVTRRLDTTRNDGSLFLKLESGFIGFSLLLPFVISRLAAFQDIPAVHILLYAAFFLMSFLSGLLVGLQFPLAAKIHLGLTPGKKPFGRTSGLLYGADLLGGFFGGLAGGVLLLPVFGLRETCLLLALVKTGSFLLFLVFTKTQK